MRSRPPRTGARPAPAAALVCLALLAGCSDGATPADDPAPASTATPGDDQAGDPLDLALSEPREDSYYPDIGDPGVDALHYDLDLAWDPATRTLEGTEALTFRATTDADSVRLDLGEALEVGSVLLDGAEVGATQVDDGLVVEAVVEQDERYVLELTYAGTPEPVPAPTARGDFSTTGWHTTPGGETWTMQEPHGALSWYAVNDQPSDKALYDIAVEVPSPWVGVANGVLESREDDGTTTRTEWHLDEPAASYLVTLATGEMEMTADETAAGTPITYWVPVGTGPRVLERLRVTPAAVGWLEERLGPYPFSSLGIVVVDSASGMETQTMITLGDTPYTTSRPVVLHELAHHWYGNQVTPHDWRDVWMNEGMAMYLELLWRDDRGGLSIESTMRQIAVSDQDYRDFAGPPADYDPTRFGDSNIYYSPALMWHELRERIGDEAFWPMVRAWPAARDNQSTGRDDYWSWIEEQTGEELTDFFDAWLLGETTPPVD